MSDKKGLLAMVKKVLPEYYNSLKPRSVVFEGMEIIQFTDLFGTQIGLRFAFRDQYWVCYSLIPLDRGGMELLNFMACAVEMEAGTVFMGEDHTTPPEAALIRAVLVQEVLDPEKVLEELAGLAEADKATRQ